jgi:hypothetical protein
VYDPAIDTDAFPGTTAMYWPATTVADVSGNVWGIEFFDGSVTVRATTHFNYVRCVR